MTNGQHATRWTALLSEQRVPRANASAAQGAPADPRTPFQTDYARIVFSTAFRRLARKTQVHPLAENDHVHNRLTHSIEVASVGRSLGSHLARFLIDRGDMPPERTDDLLWIMSAACLCHDIGNPPFGHAGENALRDWAQRPPELAFGTPLDENRPATESVDDFLLFEGNAQGYRLASWYDNNRYGYLRLTYATLGAMVKYPWISSHPDAKAKGKHNVYSTERDIFDAMNRELGLFVEPGLGRRHPMSLLTEAADDICYRVLDLEDAGELGIIHESEIHDLFSNALGLDEEDAARASARPISERRSRVMSALIPATWSVFENDYEAIMAGERTTDLASDLPEPLKEFMNAVDALYKARIFSERSKVASELGAHKALGRIAGSLCEACRELTAGSSYKSCGFRARRCLELAWGLAYITENERQPYDWWLHQTMDYLSSLTDNYARQLSREIEGT